MSRAEGPETGLDEALGALVAHPPQVDWDHLVRKGVARRQRTQRLVKGTAAVIVLLAGAVLTHALGFGAENVVVDTIHDPVTSTQPAPQSTTTFLKAPLAGPTGDGSSERDPESTPLGTAHAYLGTSVLPQGKESHLEAFRRTENLTGRTFALNHQFHQWDDEFPTNVQVDDRNAGRVPFLNWRPIFKDKSVVTWASIVNGNHDAVITARAAGLRELGVPVLFSFNANPFDETEQGWGTPAEYTAAFRHVVGIFRSQGAENVVFAWVMDGEDFKAGRADAFYPGDDVVDWVGAAVFNQFRATNRWDTLPTLLTPFLDWARTHDKIVFVPEFGCEEDPSDPDRKASWLDEARAFMVSQPQIRAAVYFSADGIRGKDGSLRYWQVDSSPASLAAWRRLALDPWFSL